MNPVLDSSCLFMTICQYQQFTSNAENHSASPRLSIQSSRHGNGKTSIFVITLSFRQSKQKLSFLPGFGAMTTGAAQLDTHVSITLISSIFSISSSMIFFSSGLLCTAGRTKALHYPLGLTVRCDAYSSEVRSQRFLKGSAISRT